MLGNALEATEAQTVLALDLLCIPRWRSYTKKGRELVVTGDAAEAASDDDDGGPRQFELPKQLKQHFLEVHFLAP